LGDALVGCGGVRSVKKNILCEREWGGEGRKRERGCGEDGEPGRGVDEGKGERGGGGEGVRELKTEGSRGGNGVRGAGA